MTNESLENKTNEISLEKVLREELSHLRPDFSNQPEKLELNEVLGDFHNAELKALCFSGGGIRSATFGLGIVQALAKKELLDRFDYLSTVSGGGYLGSWLSAWIRREQMNKFEAKLNEKKDLLKRDEDELEQKTGELADYRRLAGSVEAVLPERIKEFKDRIAQLNDEIARLRGEIAQLNLQLFDIYNQTQTDGVAEVQKKLKECTIPVQAKARLQSPNPEPKQLQFLREYSNYMSPKVGLLSADTWTLLAIYLRNLFLNWTIFIPLLSAVLLLPRVLLEVQVLSANLTGKILMLSGGLFFGILAVFLTVGKLPSKNARGETVKYNTDAGVFMSVILPLVLMAYGATTFWGWYKAEKAAAVINAANAANQGQTSTEFLWFLGFSCATFVVGNFSYLIYNKFFRKSEISFRWKEIFYALISSAVGGSLTWLLAYNVFENGFFKDWNADSNHAALYLCFAVPLYLLSFSIGSAVFVGVYSRVATDEDREWLARQGAWVLIVCGAWIVCGALVLFGPQGLQFLFDVTENLFVKNLKPTDFYGTLASLLGVFSAIAGSGILSLGGGFSGESLIKETPKKTRLNRFLDVAPRIAAVVFLGFIFILLAYSSYFLLLKVESFYAGFYNPIAGSRLDFWFFWFVVLAVIGVGMAFFINVNKFSLHAAYRDRLIRAYLGASNPRRKGNTFTGFDDADNFQLHRLKGQKPFHVVNATLNLVNGSNLAWQNRKAASFTMSPLHCGNWLLGYRRANEYCRNENLANCADLRYCNRTDAPCKSVEGNDCKLKGKALRLGTAMTISGAAANPNMGYYSSSVVTFLMTLFNIRLGWWLGNTGEVGDSKDWFGDYRIGKYFGWGKEFYKKPSPSVAVLPLLNETFGRTDEKKAFLNVTDGGHFENLGLYEMILRRCKLIVLSDAAADGTFTFGEISNAIEKCKVDLGVEINFDNNINLIFSRHHTYGDGEKKTRRRFAIAEIIYPEKDGSEPFRGKLVYVRPTFYGSEPTEIKHYANSNFSFPHQSTADQLYDEKQFEAYRALGFHIMSKVLEDDSVAPLLPKKSAKKPNDAPPDPKSSEDAAVANEAEST